MASLRFIFLLLAFTSRLFFCSSARKELGDKETYQGNVTKLFHSVKVNKIDPSRVIELSWQPRVFLYSGFLSDEECDHLVSLANGAKGKKLETSLHSDNVFMNRTQLTTKDDIVARIEERISAWTFLPKENSKPLHVMHYGFEESKQKLDYFGNKSMLGLSDRLMATVILYLSNVTRGGEILFPDSMVKNKMWSDCTKVSNVQRPIKGNAILFFSLRPNASLDESSSHGRCPVLEGEMWCAAKFFQVRNANKEKFLVESDGDECTDEDEDCPHWAATGECQRNPVFMIGTPDYYGTCRKSCSAC
ncbi:probable prolyl 4-hydroxylase 12 [Mangifera indica]|uniref:probable prolyl 4-hydroxylase 12 n=1 Tax=Mangifera indica TaxID=29780 RepID=UPI001CFB5A8B|nr:probable prolyl 4-hydroxylase 12 [Mangifera indica]